MLHISTLEFNTFTGLYVEQFRGIHLEHRNTKLAQNDLLKLEAIFAEVASYFGLLAVLKYALLVVILVYLKIC